MMMTDISILAAFLAGILSISSPCVLPLVPIYLVHIAGVSAADGGGNGAPVRVAVMRNALAYVAGFSMIFIALGAALGAAGAFAGALDVVSANRSVLVRVGGVVLIALGLYQTGIVRIPFLDRDRRLTFSSRSRGTVSSSFLIGVSFAAGWSPCVGPILGAIMTMAYGQESIGRATLLLTVYALGLAVPFLTVAAAFGSSPGFVRRINGRLHAVTTVSGAVLLGVGIIMLTGMYEQLFTDIIRAAPWSPWEPTL